MKSLVFILVVALLVAVACGYEEEQENWEDFMDHVAKRGKAQLRANPYYSCVSELTGENCVCNRLYRKGSPKHQTLCTGT